MFKDMYIIKKAGECIYNLNLSGIRHTKDKKSPDAQLFSGFLSAIMTFYDHMHGGGTEKSFNCDIGGRNLDYFSLRNYYYFILNTNEFYFCLIHDGVNQKQSKGDICNLLNKIADKFYEYTERGVFDIDTIKMIKNDEFEQYIRGLISESIREKLLSGLISSATNNAEA